MIITLPTPLRLGLISFILALVYLLWNRRNLNMGRQLGSEELTYQMPEIPPQRQAIIEETTIPWDAHSEGFTLFDRLYLRSGIFYVVTPDASKFPPRSALIGSPWRFSRRDSEPASELVFVAPSEAVKVLGENVVQMKGLSVIVYDADTLLKHYYHWWGENMLGFWRVYSTQQLHSSEPLPLPNRIVLPFTTTHNFRDPPNINVPLMRAAFPNTPIEGDDAWNDWKKLDRTFMFERAFIINREAAHTNPLANEWNKMLAGTMKLRVPDLFWEPIRQRTVGNLLGYLPQLETIVHTLTGLQKERSLPRVVYISRQTAHSRRLSHSSHDSLVESLQNLQEEGLCTFSMIDLDDQMTIAEQVGAVADATFLITVHGNALTHQLWMPPTVLSTVIEIFYPGGYLFDYDVIARNMGHKHYSIWNDTFFTYPEGQYHDKVEFPPEFNSMEIPLYGPVILDIIRERLASDD